MTPDELRKLVNDWRWLSDGSWDLSDLKGASEPEREALAKIQSNLKQVDRYRRMGNAARQRCRELQLQADQEEWAASAFADACDYRRNVVARLIDDIAPIAPEES